MKKGSGILVLIFCFFICLLLGIFVGRNLTGHYAMLPMNNTVENTVSAAETHAGAQDYRLDINTATKIQLMELPGIGEMLAERIVRYRTQNGAFQNTDDLLDVEGIGEKKLQEIQALIKVGG